MKTPKLAIKPFMDDLSSFCDDLSPEQLKQVILGLAKTVPAHDRGDFVETVKLTIQDPRKAVKPNRLPVEDLVSEIHALKENIASRIEAIEDGSYWDAPDEYDEDWDDHYDDDQYRYDDEPESLSENQIQELTSLFGQAEALFLDDRIEDARTAYAALFDIVEAFQEEMDEFVADAVDIREARAQFCRSVYETTKPGERPDAVAAAMDIDLRHPFHDQARFDRSRPMMQDVIDAKTDEMKDLDGFFKAWRKLLEKRWAQHRPARLLLEAVHHLSGVEGVSGLARKWQDKQPAGYQFWLDILKEHADSKEIIGVSLEALGALKQGDAKRTVAEVLMDAAAAAGDAPRLLEGRRERFFARPDGRSLLAWTAEAARQEVRSDELDKAIQFLLSCKSRNPDQEGLLVKCLLMAGRLEDAFQRVKSEKGVGWSYRSSAGVVFGAVLSAICRQAEKAATVQAVFRGYANGRSTPVYGDPRDPGADTRFDAEIVAGLKAAGLTAQKRHEYLSWAEEIGKRRIDHIVSNKHRNAYERAAQVLCALVETYLIRNRDDHAFGMLRHFCREKYNRFSAFKSEVAAVMAASPLLKNMDLKKLP